MNFPTVSFLIFLFFVPLKFLAGEHATTSPQISRPVKSTIESIPENACSQSDYKKYSGMFNHITEDDKVWTGANPAFPLFEQKVDRPKVTKYYSGSPYGGGKVDFDEYQGFHLDLHPKVFENFALVLSHALNCLIKREPNFYNELKKQIKSASEPPYEPFNKSYRHQAKNYVDRNIEKDPSFQKDVEAAKSFLSQIDFLESLRQDFPEFLDGIQEQLLNNTKKEEKLSNKLSDVVLEMRRQIKPPANPYSKAAKMAGMVMENPLFASLFPPNQVSFYRQLLQLGPSLAFKPKSEGTKPESETYQEHTRRLEKTLQDSFPGAKKSLDFLSHQPSSATTSPLERATYWSDFEKQVRSDLDSLKPNERNQLRDRLLQGMRDLEQTTNWSYSPDIAHAREALVRASRLIESGTEDPIPERRSIEEKALKGHFSNQIEVIKKALNHPESSKTKGTEAILARAEKEYQITIPEAVKNRIRELDPFLLNILKDNLHMAPSLKNFFLTGHTTALFNLKDKDVSRLLANSLESRNRQNTKLSSSEKLDLMDLLSLTWHDPNAYSDYFKKSEKWKKTYPELRKKLLSELNHKDLTEADKAILYTVEMLDSINNHEVNPYNDWQEPSLQNFYEPKEIAARFHEEKTLLEKTNSKSEELEARISDLIPQIPGDSRPYHGIPSYARVAALKRKERGEEETAQTSLKLLSDLMTHGEKKNSPEKQDAIKGLIFSDSDRTQWTAALASQSPESVALFTTLEGPPQSSSEDFPLRTEWENFIKNQNREISDAIRQAKVQLLLATQDKKNTPEMTNNLMGALKLLEEYDAAGPESFLNMKPQHFLFLSSFLPPESKKRFTNILNKKEKDEKPTLARVIYNQEQLSTDPKGTLISDEQAKSAKEQLLLAKQREDSFIAVARLRNRLGEKDERYIAYREHLKEKFPADFDKRLESAAKRLTEDEKTKEEGKLALLRSYNLDWDEEHQAFVVDLNDTRISQDMVKDLSEKYPDYRLIFRNKKTGKDSIFHDGEKALKDWYGLRAEQYIAGGLPITQDQWFPLNNKTAVKLVESDGGLRAVLGNRQELEAEFNRKLKTDKDLQTRYQDAQNAYGHWTHGSEGFFRGFGNFWLAGFVDGPEASKRTKDLIETWNQKTSSKEALQPFGYLESDGKSAITAKSESLDWMKGAVRREGEQIQKYSDSAELTYDATFFTLSLLAGGLPGFFVKGTAMTAAEVATLRQGAGLLGRGLGIGTQVRMGLSTFRNLGASSIYNSAIFSAPLGIGYGVDSYMTSNKMAEIEKRFKESGKKWRKHAKQPERKEGQSEEDYNKEWAEWAEESQWDLDDNGEPDFLQSNLKAYARSGPETERYLQGFFDTQRSLFFMGGVGQALPNSGMLAHVFGGSYLDQQMKILKKKGVTTGVLKPEEQLGALKDSGLATAYMVPGIGLQRIGMATVPASLQRQFKLGPIATDTKEIVGTLGFTFGNQATHAAVNQTVPKLTDINTLAAIGMDLYVGGSTARAANIEMAKSAITRLGGAPKTPGLPSPKGSSSTQAPRTLLELSQSNQFSPEAVDLALTTLSRNQLSQIKSPTFLEEARQYIQTRTSQIAEQLKNNPYKEKNLQQLEQEISGAKGWRLRNSSLAELKKAFELKSQEAQLLAWGERTGPQQMLDNQLVRLGGNEVAQERLRETLSSVTTPEVSEALIDAARRTTPLTTRLKQGIGNYMELAEESTGIPSAFWRPSPGLPPAESAAAIKEHERANRILIEAFTASEKPKVQEQIGNIISHTRPEAFAGLKAQAVDPQSTNATDAVKTFLMWKVVEIYKATGQRPADPKELFQNFHNSILKSRKTSPDKTLETLWEEFSGGTVGKPENLYPKISPPQER